MSHTREWVKAGIDQGRCHQSRFYEYTPINLFRIWLAAEVLPAILRTPGGRDMCSWLVRSAVRRRRFSNCLKAFSLSVQVMPMMGVLRRDRLIVNFPFGQRHAPALQHIRRPVGTARATAMPPHPRAYLRGQLGGRVVRPPGCPHCRSLITELRSRLRECPCGSAHQRPTQRSPSTVGLSRGALACSPSRCPSAGVCARLRSRRQSCPYLP
jgi:hypothetical protein